MLNVGMGSLGEMIREARERKGLAQADVAEKIGVRPQTILNIENGKTHTMRRGKLPVLAEVLGVPLVDLVSASRDRPRINGASGKAVLERNVERVKMRAVPVRRVPVFRFVPADRMGGPEGFYQSDLTATDYVDAPATSRDCMVVILDGDCMEPDFKSGDRVLVDFERTGREGLVPGAAYYIATRGEDQGRVTFKRYFGEVDGKHVFDCINRRYRKKFTFENGFNAAIAVAKLL